MHPLFGGFSPCTPISVCHGDDGRPQIDIGYQCMGAPMTKVHSERWTEDLFGEGPQLGHDHVLIPKEWMAKLPPRVDREVDLLRTIWDEDEISDASRLSCMLPLSKAVDGMVVYMPDRVPDDCP